jgi:hypothetical protein
MTRSRYSTPYDRRRRVSSRAQPVLKSQSIGIVSSIRPGAVLKNLDEA